MKYLSYRLGDLELRNTGDGLVGSKNPATMEIVQWNGDHCRTIAYWNKEFDLVFVTNSPLFDKDENKLDFLELAKVGLKHLKESIQQ